MFNSLECVKKLEGVGVSRQQAEIHVQIMSELMESNLVTGDQLKEFGFVLRSEFRDEFAELKEDMAKFRIELNDLHHRFDQLEARLTIKLGIMMGAMMTILLAILKLT